MVVSLSGYESSCWWGLAKPAVRDWYLSVVGLPDTEEPPCDMGLQRALRTPGSVLWWWNEGQWVTREAL